MPCLWSRKVTGTEKEGTQWAVRGQGLGGCRDGLETCSDWCFEKILWYLCEEGPREDPLWVIHELLIWVVECPLVTFGRKGEARSTRACTLRPHKGSCLPAQEQEELTQSTGRHWPVASPQPRQGRLQLSSDGTGAAQAHRLRATMLSWIYIVATQSYALIVANTACGPEPRGADV